MSGSKKVEKGLAAVLAGRALPVPPAAEKKPKAPAKVKAPAKKTAPAATPATSAEVGQKKSTTAPEGWVQHGTYLEKPVKRALKVYSATTDVSMNTIVNDAVRAFLKEKGVKVGE